MQFEPLKDILRLMSYLFVGMVVLAIFTYFIARLAWRHARLVSRIIEEGEEKKQ